MLLKEWTTPAVAARGLFFWAPIISLGLSLAVFLPIPFGPPIVIGNTIIPLQVTMGDSGFLLLLGIAGLSVYGILLGAWASGNKLGLLGGMRASAMMISYEVPLTLSVIGILLCFGTTDLFQGVMLQNEKLWGSIPAWGILMQPFGAILFFWVGIAETKRTPFDLPEGESEIIGFFVEYSSMGFGGFLFSEFIEIVALSAIFTTLFLGGYNLPFILEGTILFGTYDIGSIGAAIVGVSVFGFKVLILCLAQLHIRWSLPRTRYDLVMSWGWKIMIPASLLNIAFTAALIYLDPSRHILVSTGIAIWVVMLFVLIAGLVNSDKRKLTVLEA